MALFIREYGHLVRKRDIASHDKDAVAISQGDFDFLESRMYATLDETDEHRFFLKPSIFRGKKSLQVQNHVGVLQTPTGTQIEILPKIFSGHGQELGFGQVRNILIRMLGYLRNSPFRQGDSAMLIDASVPLLEVFIGYFLEQVNRLVKRGIRSDYVSTSENLAFMKGKLLVANQLRHNIVHRHRFYVKYDEFQVNRTENRLIRSALEKVGSFISRSDNQRLWRELFFAFDGVPPAIDFRMDLARCSKDRSMAYYEHVLDWCRIILLDQSPIGAAGATRSISLLFPMERIFEDYVAARLQQRHSEWQITTQARDHHLMQQNGKNYFLMKPDLVFRQGRIKVVVDTKWKLLGQDCSQPIHMSIGQADLYQMYAYGKKYLHDQLIKEVYLIYPKSSGFTNPLPVFEYQKDFRLFVVPYDLSLEVDDLLLDEEGYLQA